MTERDVVAHLRTKGFRITRGRIALLRFALASKGPFSAPEIHKRFTKKGLQSNLVTIYREFDQVSRRVTTHPDPANPAGETSRWCQVLHH
jgi:Fe2+ or Zn2+ uptake regulation protein